jgi:hypothetical protein
MDKTETEMIYYLAARKWLFLNTTRRPVYDRLSLDIKEDLNRLINWNEVCNDADVAGYTTILQLEGLEGSTLGGRVNCINLKGLWHLHVHKHLIHDFYKKYLG